MNAPTIQSVRQMPTLPTSLAIAPGVANIPLPITLEMKRMYALLHPKFLPRAVVSGSTSFSTDLSGWISATFSSRDVTDFAVLLKLDRNGDGDGGRLQRRGSRSDMSSPTAVIPRQKQTKGVSALETEANDMGVWKLCLKVLA